MSNNLVQTIYLDAKLCEIAEHFLRERKVPGGYEGMHMYELAAAIQQTIDTYIDRQWLIYGTDP